MRDKGARAARTGYRGEIGADIGGGPPDPRGRAAWGGAVRSYYTPMRRHGPRDPRGRWRARTIACSQTLPACGKREIIIIAAPIKRVEILKMRLKQPPPQRRPCGGCQGLGKGGRNDKWPTLVVRGHARHGHRIAERKAAPIGRRADIDPCQGLIGA